MGMSVQIRTLVDNILKELIGERIENVSVVKINSSNLSNNGDLSILINLCAWKDYISPEIEDELMNILEYYFYRNEQFILHSSDETAEKVFEALIHSSRNWPLKIEKCTLQKERVCIFLNRPHAMATAIKTIIEFGSNYGRALSNEKNFAIEVLPDFESHLTNVRLHIIKDVTRNILRLQGYQISENGHFKHILTVKSQGEIENNYKRIVCGVVKSSQMGTKEKELTWDMYITRIMDKLSHTVSQKFFSENAMIDDYNDVLNIAKAVATFELLSVKPSRAVLLKADTNYIDNVINKKGGLFVLYNTVRIAAIFEKYNERRCKGMYPALTHIDDVDFSLLTQEEEWELVYNFILGYSKLIENGIRHEPTLEPCPQVVCAFLSQLCKMFSVYYCRFRVLTSLQIVLHNALAILGIDRISHM
ncbi:DALR anticodon-binding domain-containing protein 3 isoform X2 [Orussus abietinus]|uniref:DALR anticodon-binding domain-containing protein 3 isoform X2 n=1 Tax=Orussus abietinus TaxID=222816 RepID=UPI00062557C3|nr:DALR anticodon-binding domain-containing protein 3 isoform X2 [Orussus abietinus]